MKVNMYALIKLMLPTFLRGNKVSEMVRAMLLQLEYAFNRFDAKTPDWLYRANTNASVQCMEHHIRRELDVDATITELDGKPIDFLVTITGFVDENLLRVLIDTYKIAGKNYVFRVGSVTYNAQFTNNVCENIRELWTAEFSEYVCEKKYEITFSANVAKTTGSYQYLLTVTASDKVTSDIFIQVTVKYFNTQNENIGGKIQNVTLYANSTVNSAGYNEVITIPYASVANTSTEIVNISPVEDNNNVYKI